MDIRVGDIVQWRAIFAYDSVYEGIGVVVRLDPFHSHTDTIEVKHIFTNHINPNLNVYVGAKAVNWVVHE